ncbi:hypothetical protein RHGRI_022606 [Rhododendron griersonianum]|uniref:RNase H type-1 domain-containing protein n=1 Tax=Rhododendron griersonianum TaxID=479676 RepID=A0AAV6J064_9ERIC|nr:hypothetical protein RHGRI_022606 [Rhododendron griersonianum]
MFNAQTRQWRSPLISVLFPEEVAQYILSLYVVPQRDVEVELAWEHTKDGCFVEKENGGHARMSDMWECVGDSNVLSPKDYGELRLWALILMWLSAFQGDCCKVDDALAHFLQQNVEEERLSPCIFVTSGAWNSDLMSGTARVRKGKGGTNLMQQVDVIPASSAALAQITPGLQMLEWAINNGIEAVSIHTDCPVFVQGLNKPNKSSSNLQMQ